METSVEAYYFAIDKIEELKREGIKVNFKPSNSKNDPKIIKKFNSSERIPPDLWYHITFEIKESDNAKKLSELANYLGMAGIRFDTGGCGDYSDWEFDWSFQYHKGTENEDWRDARNIVDDLLDDIDCNFI